MRTVTVSNVYDKSNLTSFTSQKLLLIRVIGGLNYGTNHRFSSLDSMNSNRHLAFIHVFRETLTAH